MKPWDLDKEHGEFLVFKYKLAGNRPMSVVVLFKNGRSVTIERRTWNGCGWELI